MRVPPRNKQLGVFGVVLLAFLLSGHWKQQQILNSTFPDRPHPFSPEPSSRERLLRLTRSFDACGTIDNVSVSIVISQPDFTYVNCGVLGTPSNPPLLITPRSLLQCPDFQPLVDNHDMAIVPRDDLFAIALQPESHLSLGSVHFHFYNYLNSTIPDDRLTVAEWLLGAIIPQPIEAWYPHMGSYLTNALGCACEALASCRCPIRTETTMTTAFARPVVTSDAKVTGVQLTNFYPDMYQIPNTGPKQSVRIEADAKMVDTVTPSVAVFRKVYAEVGSGRIFVETTPSKHRCEKASKQNDMRKRSPFPKREGLSRQYLVQFNQCYVKWDMNDFHVPFKGAVYMKKFQTASTVKVFDKVVLLAAHFYNGFYHAMVENLPRLLLVKDLLQAHPNLTVVACRLSHMADQDDFMYQMAKIWNLESRLVFLDQEDVIHANVVVVPEPTPCGQAAPLMVKATQRAIRQKLLSMSATSARHYNFANHPRSNNNTLERFGLASSRQLEPLFDMNDKWILVIRRRSGGRRCIGNHDEMVMSLRATFPNETLFVFDETDASTFPPVGLPQWTAFARAKLVIAPHGGGLGNILACDVGTHVVEYYGHGTDTNLCYLHLSVALNLHHHPLKMDAPDKDETNGKKNAYTIDVAHLLRVVSDILHHI